MTDETQDNGRKLFADIQPTDELTKHEVGMIEAEVRKEIDREAKQLLKDKLREALRVKLRQERGIEEPEELVTAVAPQRPNRGGSMISGRVAERKVPARNQPVRQFRC